MLVDYILFSFDCQKCNICIPQFIKILNQKQQLQQVKLLKTLVICYCNGSSDRLSCLMLVHVAFLSFPVKITFANGLFAFTRLGRFRSEQQGPSILSPKSDQTELYVLICHGILSHHTSILRITQTYLTATMTKRMSF